jgi:hypothetical protein
MLFRDEEEGEDRAITDLGLGWSNRAWVVVPQLSPLAHNEGGIIDGGDNSTREGYAIDGFLYRMIAASTLNTRHVPALGGDLPLPGPLPPV